MYGTLQVERGTNTFNLEENACHWGVPQLPKEIVTEYERLVSQGRRDQ